MNKPLVFLKIRGGDDVVGYLYSNTDTHYIIARPLNIIIETDLPSGRQMIEVRECLPPILVELEQMSFAVGDVTVITPIRDSFKEELASVIKLFYSVKPLKRKQTEKVKRDEGDNVISFVGRDIPKIH